MIQMNETVGVLALQGAYQKHCDILSRLEVASRLIRRPNELSGCCALIIPGGESTTISLLIQEYGLYEAIRYFAENHAVLGVCAGLIMMATEVDDRRIKPLKLIPFRALRNHYGHQVHSSTSDIKLSFSASKYSAHFIRAPGVTKISQEVKVLASCNNEAVMINKGKHVAVSFHPELTNDMRIHQYWLHNCVYQPCDEPHDNNKGASD
ncbi:MAG: pyridoxal 5'-phosphate synthase glutaminase subunit PdxT [Thiotrichaceae bacterium]|nr:MAG: pyridoxal 5'-phosphate synthase glutaminase subunit PdxT [Thiotrichaceae bacterium]